jgi:general secretion pathway protein F
VRRAPVRREIADLAAAVEAGQGLGGAMGSSRFFDATVREMIVVSEASGKLGVVLQRLAAQRHRAFQARIETLLSLVEPVIILAIGAVVALTVIALLLPVLLMNTLVG